MDLKKIYIRGLRVDEWPLLRAKRLEAIKENPGYFVNSITMEEAFNQEKWESMLCLKDGKIFGLFDERKLIGITGVFLNNHDPSGKCAKLGMTYLERNYRGRGLSALFYEARLDWAKAYGYERVIVSHRQGNEPSRRANAPFGFKWISSEELDYGDGKKALDCRYELKLITDMNSNYKEF